MSDRDSRQKTEQDTKLRNLKGHTKGIVFALVILILMLVLMAVVGRPLLAVSRDPEALEAYLESQGIWGVWIYMGMVILQIFAAVVPGGPFEIAGGY